jgi:hypothetical protein
MTPDERKDARAYAWGYFALHADQRMKLFVLLPDGETVHNAFFDRSFEL